MRQLLTWVVEPGFFSSQPVHVALIIGAAAAAVSAVVGISPSSAASPSPAML